MKHKIFTVTILSAILLFVSVMVVEAYIDGITGRTLKTSASGCGGCHGSTSTSDVIVTIAGPDTVIKSQSAQYTLTVSKPSKTGAGFDIATRRGTLSPVSSNMHLASGELTHNNNIAMTNGTVTVTFNYMAPATTGLDTIWATGNATNSNGNTSGDDWNWAPSKRIVVREPLGIQGSSTVVGYELKQNYPNPFNPSTTINFELGKSSNVNLTIYDISGKAVSVLVNKNMTQGKHEITWDASGFASGVYFYRIEAQPFGSSNGNFADQKKMILLK